MINDGDILRCGLCLTTEQRDDGLRVVIIHIILVERVEQIYLSRRGDGDVAEQLLCEESVHHRLITLQELADECLTILIGAVFCLYIERSLLAISFHVDGTFARVVVQSLLTQRLLAELVLREQRAMPGKGGGDLQT